MISLIATVLNEKENISAWVGGLLGQSKLPDEIVIVDGGSTDGTWEWLSDMAGRNNILKVFQHRGNIASGRNFAITNARGDKIVVTDAGCIYDKDWFVEISAAFSAGHKFISTAFGPWLENNGKILPILIAATTTPAPAEFRKNWLPSSRSVAFIRELWQNVGGYPEWIPICEDIIFDLKMRKMGVETEYIRRPLVFWKPRQTLGAYFYQLYRYTKSDGHGKLWLNRQLTRYAVYIASILLLALSAAVDWRFVSVLLLGLVVYMFKFWHRWLALAKSKRVGIRICGLILVPFVVAFGDVAKMCGWPAGVWERRSGKVKFEQY